MVEAGAAAGAVDAGSGVPVAGRATLGKGIWAQPASVIKLNPPAVARVRKAEIGKRIVGSPLGAATAPYVA
ncbi:hypothetical protein GCM10023172_11860 [Hymenobacter ginsengisoli]|uniref:Uncharacterized protein n=1 Tax=Hymenobacter ginsengisoli TaxID=1051626 RepID=A0ABP8Q6Z6_9BACT